ncbi:MAG: thioesterase [Actinomycetia bacterium]|nr:thioesterase [Actinomycetes bacterium]
MTGTAELTVSDADTAIALGSGDLAVLGTPRVLALCEEASVAVLADHVSSEETSVGTNVALDHLAASGIGAAVEAIATVTAVEGRKILFDVEVVEGDKVVAKGTHERFIVDRARFLGSVPPNLNREVPPEGHRISR